METYYTHLNKKIDHLKAKQWKPTRSTPNNQEKHEFYNRIKNLTNIKFTEKETELLKYGLQYSIEKPLTTYFTNLIIETEKAIKLLDKNYKLHTVT